MTPVTLVGLLSNFHIHSYEINIPFDCIEIDTVLSIFVIDSLPRPIHDGVLSTIPILMFRSCWRIDWFGFIADVLDDLCIGLCGLLRSWIKQCLINA